MEPLLLIAYYYFFFIFDVVVLALYGLTAFAQVVCATLLIFSPFLVSGLYITYAIGCFWKLFYTVSLDVIMAQHDGLEQSVREVWLYTFMISNTLLLILFACSRRTKVDRRETFIDYKKTFVDPTSNTATDKRL